MATWHTTQVPKGEWVAAFDTWFGMHPMTTGQADIEAGFELWQGGTGLATDWFWARA